MNDSIILMGIKHSGKSTQGRFLAKSLACSFVDVDDVIAEIAGQTPREIYTLHGEGSFMKWEEEACRRMATENVQKRLVIATGGGICDNAPALQVLRSMGRFIFLNVAENIAVNRILNKACLGEDGSWLGLPAYIAKENPQDESDVRAIFHEFYVKRIAVYSKIADIKIDISDKTKDENARLIAKAIGA